METKHCTMGKLFCKSCSRHVLSGSRNCHLHFLFFVLQLLPWVVKHCLVVLFLVQKTEVSKPISTFSSVFKYLSSSSKMSETTKQCTMRLALKKHVSIRIGQNDDLGSHFLMPELFQMKIFGSFLLCSFTFNLYLGTSWKKSSAAAEVAKESVTIQTGCRKDVNKIERTSWTVPLKTESQYFLLWSKLWKYLENICLFQM